MYYKRVHHEAPKEKSYFLLTLASILAIVAIVALVNLR